MSKESNTGYNIGLLVAIFIVFLVLKLTGTITWSWLWVTAPLWGPLSVLLVFLFIALTVHVIKQIW